MTDNDSRREVFRKDEQEESYYRQTIMMQASTQSHVANFFAKQSLTVIAVTIL
jgi:hypothetical protein